MKKCCTIDAWRDSKYSSASEYGMVRQGAEQNAPLSIAHMVLNMPLMLSEMVRLQRDVISVWTVF